MGDGKKKCCGKYEKKGKHCGGCPLAGDTKKCKPDKDHCKGCKTGDKKKKKGKKKKK